MAEAQGFPALTGRVVDAADLLSAADEVSLTGKSAGLEARTKHQFVIVTVPTLGGKPIENYSLALGNHWGIGRKDANDGVLLVVAPKERKVRIEVGLGLEKALTNEEAAAILRDKVLPAFRDNKMRDGIVAGADAIIAEISPA